MFPILARKFSGIAKNPKLFAAGWSLWPPFLGAGIKVESISDDYRKIDVSMKLSLKNTNYVGTHFGGSLYAMTDPFFMIMFIKNLGPKYIVWDKAAKIDFKKPGKGKVKVHFEINQNDIDKVIESVNEHEKKSSLWHREVQILNEQNEVVAVVLKTIYVKLKPQN